MKILSDRAIKLKQTQEQPPAANNERVTLAIAFITMFSFEELLEHVESKLPLIYRSWRRHADDNGAVHIALHSCTQCYVHDYLCMQICTAYNLPHMLNESNKRLFLVVSNLQATTCTVIVNSRCYSYIYMI